MPLLDLIIVVAYLCGILAVGILSTRKQKLTSLSYFLAGRNLGWGMIGAALFASNISTIHLIGLAASGYNEGLVWGNFEWLAGLTLILLALVFVPFYYKSRISTLPEFLERRYSPASRSFLAFIGILAALFIHIGMSLYAGATVFEQFFGIDVLTSIVVISLVTAVYTVLGGLRAVVVTETIQTAILLFGAVAITLFALFALPEHGIHSLAQFKAALKPNQLSMLHSSSPVGLTWLAVFLGYPILGIHYWCTDQTIVQRVLGARSEKDGQWGALLAGFLKILPVFIMVFPGILAYVLFQDQIGNDSNSVLPVLINQLVPTGLKGLISAGLLAALMSTIAAALNSSATLVAVDIVKRIKPTISDQKQVRIGRITAIFIMLAAMTWSTQGGRFSSIFEAVAMIAAYLSPPVATVFLLGVFWKRGTKEASLLTLILGFSLGAGAFLIDLPVLGSTKIITDNWGIPFMLQAWWIFFICCLVFVMISISTPRPSEKQIRGLTWDTPAAVFAQGRIKSLADPRILAGILILTLTILYVIFH